MSSSKTPNSPDFLKILKDLHERSLEKEMSLQEVVELLGPKSHSLLILVLSLPFLQPIPLLGLSTPLGLLITLVAFFSLMKKPAWIPHRWREKKISSELLSKISEGAEKIWSKIEKLLHPRWKFFVHSRGAQGVQFLVISSLALLLALPLPIPFSNTVPALGLVFTALGQLEEDGVMICLSWIVFFGACFFFFSVGAEAREYFEGSALKHYFFNTNR